ncbi:MULTISPECIES: M15 family metallopeptidase [unclassified Caulobacter]|uniref:M15 family metallopeptidase n=1 Tax=unclassified Caulobacter TaxID=2648921 RepID=UPI000D398F84|nr:MULTISPECIES: M15 family metallopeptidase [unclassified Caulobacter]PTS88699.1 peptidase M15 [Caulobacter sp. HMWF009]PTT05167.1 peptidase M15 [Caulobacter sp. HMWF025]
MIRASYGLVAFATLAASPAVILAAPQGADLSRVGQYGTPEAPVTILERDGVLVVDGGGHSQVRLTPQGRGVYRLDGGGTLTFERGCLVLNGTLLPRRDFGAEAEAAIRKTVRADPVALRARALAAVPPVETGPFRPADLVDLATIDPAIRFDIRYAGADNFMGLPLYERPAAYLQRPAAEALGRVQKALAQRGYGLLIHDAYRPWFVTWMFWEATPPQFHMFVADPARGSRHNRGSAVDLTLYDQKTGKVVEMPGRYDEMSARSSADFPGGTSEQRRLRGLLREAMEAEGFAVLPEEWWHFDYMDWAAYGIGTVTFSTLASR